MLVKDCQTSFNPSAAGLTATVDLFVATVWSSVVMHQHIPVEHGQLVKHPHLIRCRMVTGAAETPIGSVIGYNVVPCSCILPNLDRVEDPRVWLGGWLPYHDLMLSTMYVLNKGNTFWSRGDLRLCHIRLPHSGNGESYLLQLWIHSRQQRM